MEEPWSETKSESAPEAVKLCCGTALFFRSWNYTRKPVMGVEVYEIYEIKIDVKKVTEKDYCDLFT